MNGDRAAIDAVARALFAAFASHEVAGGSLDRLPEIFADHARVVMRIAGELRASTVDEFIAPRRALLLGGALRDFREWETDAETLVGVGIACRKSRYAKTGVRDGAPFTGGGTKVLSLVRERGVWKVLELLWEDDG